MFNLIFGTIKKKRGIGWKLREDTKRKIGKANKGKARPDMIERMKIDNPMFNRESLEKRTRTVKRLYKEGKIKPPMLGRTLPEVSKRMKEGGAMKARMANKFKPNKPEKIMIKLLDFYFPDEWKYVGDGKIWFARFNPDFINCNGKKSIIELFGDYWHQTSEAIENDKKRIDTYKKYGYNTLVIWESELKDTNLVLRKLNKFCYNSGEMERIW